MQDAGVVEQVHGRTHAVEVVEGHHDRNSETAGGVHQPLKGCRLAYAMTRR
jgi:hypothetical protein